MFAAWFHRGHDVALQPPLQKNALGSFFLKDFLEKLRIYYRVFSSDEKISFHFMVCIRAGCLPA